MRSLWICVVIFAYVASSYAQTVNLTGTVTDSADNSPLSGVRVVLAKLGYTDTTDKGGKYSLLGSPVSIIVGKSIGAATHLSINGRFLFFTLPKKEKVTAILYSPAGRAIRTIIDQEFAPGIYRAGLPLIQKSAGIYYIRVIYGNSQEIIKFLSVKERHGQNGSLDQSRGLKKISATFDDTLLFEKAGYEPKRAPVLAYEGALNITMSATPNVVDIDGNVYHTVTIGTQVWMVENLKTTTLNDGTRIPLVTEDTAWYNLTKPAYCWYENDTANKAVYGALYNWYAVNTGKLAPTGWHVPTDAEWTVLTSLLGGMDTAGGALKSADTIYWHSPNTGATNSSGFSALPGGSRYYYGAFYSIGYYGYWWSSTAFSGANASNRFINYDFTTVFGNNYPKTDGFNIRCLKN
jgi:uncharacterized protein (TIGR02145 family)